MRITHQPRLLHFQLVQGLSPRYCLTADQAVKKSPLMVSQMLGMNFHSLLLACGAKPWDDEEAKGNVKQELKKMRSLKYLSRAALFRASEGKPMGEVIEENCLGNMSSLVSYLTDYEEMTSESL